MKDGEIGGYIELEHYNGEMLHEDAKALNCGRNALAYLIKARRIGKIAIPYFMCRSVTDLCGRFNVRVRFYHIDDSFLPEKLELEEKEWLYLADFYGQLDDNDIQSLCKEHERVIVDYAQAYFKMPLKDVDSLYTCRKFFGVSDGAFLYTNAVSEEILPQDESFERMHFLLGRYERAACEFYDEYAANNELFAKAPILKMSKLTENLLRTIDYKKVKDTRTANFRYLDKRLGSINALHLKDTEGAFAYPLYMENSMEIKKRLISHKIYVPTLWPEVLEKLPDSMYEYKLAGNILPLPCDQRYGEAEMEYISGIILEMLQ